MNLRMKKKKYAVVEEIGFPKKSILQLFELRTPFRQRVC